MRLGLIVVFVGFVTGATWWAASMDANIKSMNQILGSIQASIEVFHGDRLRYESRVQHLEGRVDLIDKTGTEALRRLEVRVVALEQRKP